MAPGAEERFHYLFESPQQRTDFAGWLDRSAASQDPLYYAVIDSSSGRCEGRQALMRIVPEHGGVIEIGSILWGPAIARTRVATEALFLSARYASTSSATAASSGSAMRATSPRATPPGASASSTKETFASTWS